MSEINSTLLRLEAFKTGKTKALALDAWRAVLRDMIHDPEMQYGVANQYYRWLLMALENQWAKHDQLEAIEEAMLTLWVALVNTEIPQQVEMNDLLLTVTKKFFLEMKCVAKSEERVCPGCGQRFFPNKLPPTKQIYHDAKCEAAYHQRVRRQKARSAP